MAEAERRETSSDAGERELKDMIEHWVEVIDRWVHRIDSELEGSADGGGPVDRRLASEPAREVEPFS